MPEETPHQKAHIYLVNQILFIVFPKASCSKKKPGGVVA